MTLQTLGVTFGSYDVPLELVTLLILLVLGLIAFIVYILLFDYKDLTEEDKKEIDEQILKGLFQDDHSLH